MNKYFIIALAITTAILTCLLAFESTFFDRSFYKSEFKRLGIYEREGTFLPDNMTEAVLLFDENKIPNLNLSYLTPAEISHMEDVKYRIRFAINVRRMLVGLWLILMGFLAWKSKNPFRDIGRVYKAAGITALLFVAVIGIASLFFEPLFDLFHVVLFPQGNYLFPYPSALLRVYTFQLHYDVFFTTLIKVLFAAVVLFLLGAFIIRSSDKKLKTRRGS